MGQEVEGDFEDEDSQRDGLESEHDSEEAIAQAGGENMANMPSVNDPKLWQVRVKKGSERLAAMALMNKMIYYANNGTPLSILSATYVENIENYIFVEAYKRESVHEAI